ncbi:hypothetical protein [Anaerosalibacter massiliensis]|uniref:Tetratricopeptide repeat protein n=1 Tax=Anaerosalibacter massiliensis TaxID=1347392 RepID=A0A9X2MHJ5_9FIRM|nr:hypothetical protein [Anaerosalibacter massiliensis]MCR2043774.1 hypothetical protein [Anaerosalibacter massiliensis]
MSEKAFYKKIHPNLFSDSKVIKTGKLSKEFFSFFLESLTSQGKEKEFEDFCRRIVESTICPNLLPQTGPTGGGDSKVDSETYPVSETIAESWLYGYNDAAHNERWAFAISAKKDWKPKLKSDVKKIIVTNEEHNRGYTRIFFITNQFVSDKKRAEAEDKLRKEYKLDIRILDRTWLLDNTFKNDNQKLAISAFNMSDELNDVIDEGSKDIERKKLLDEIERELQNLEQLKPARIVKLSKESIELLRELEVDKSTIINALERNIRFAKKYGSLKKYADALYDYCWTMIWWYEDHDIYYEMYVELENLYKENTDNYPILKDLSTLWITLYSNHNQGKKVIANMESHTQLLIDSFDKFIQDYENPKRAKLAKYDYQMMRLQNPEMWDDVVEIYLEILQDLHFNNDIDLFQLKKIMELPILKKCSKYDELFELLINLLGEQSRNIESSQLLLNRGDDYLESDVYKSIKFYSRALTKLYNENSKIDLIKTLMKLGGTFEQIGLFWGARSYYIRAFMDSINLYFDEGNAIPGLFLSMRSLKYLELRLGRIDHSLRFNELELLGLNLYPYGTDDEKEWEKYLHYDALLAIALLNLTRNNIEQFERFPDYLKEKGLETSSATLKYSLGYYDEDYIQAMGSKEALDVFMKDLFKQPASNDFQEILNIDFLTEKIKLKTKIVGCNVIVNTRRNSFQRELGATILAMLENIFATSISNQIVPMFSDLTVNIEEIEESQFDIEVIQKDNTIDIHVSKIEELTEYINRGLVSEKLNIVMAMFISQMVPLSSELVKIKKSIEEEEAMFRTLNCSSTLDTFVVFEQGISFKDTITKETKVYKNIRDKSIFQHNESKTQKSHTSMEGIRKIHYGELPKEIDFSKVHHNKIQISDIIYLPLWDKAGWKGLSILTDQDFEYPPFVGLIFDNKEGLDIFKKWKIESKADKITIGIITGIDKYNPYWYRIVIGENMFNTNFNNSDNDLAIINQMTRLHTMQAKNDFNINLLKQALTKHKTFNFLPILTKDLVSKKLRTELAFIKKSESIIVKDVSEILEKDTFLINGLMPFDKPVNNTDKELFAEKLIKEKQKISRKK